MHLELLVTGDTEAERPGICWKGHDQSVLLHQDSVGALDAAARHREVGRGASVFRLALPTAARTSG